MCFGKKEKVLFPEDEAPRPAPGHFPQQPTYADSGPKATYQQPPPPQSPYTVSPLTPAPPSGPPPAELSAMTHSNPPAELSSDYAPPSGPPPSHRINNDYAPPPGPPPSKATDDWAAPPPGPPPSHAAKHEWESAVPDTSLFPPPPALFSGFYRSPTSNATESEAEAGESWCAQFPLTPPLDLDPAALAALAASDIRLMTPSTGFLGSLSWSSRGVWSGSTSPKATDSCIIGYPPLYVVKQHSPLATVRPKTIYYEVVVKSAGQKDVNLALGFTALPYPSFRMPGWHRGSLAVHGDDGHKFINDRWGGKSFTEPFRVGETVGIGMKFRVVEGGRIETEIFFTRGGRLSGSWNLHEETDAQEDLPVTGLEGFHDLSCAIGTYQSVGFDVVFEPGRWLYRPPQY